ncbi:MAG TPA: DUF1059 domain-containing protein [Thermomicrobiales bacterium]|jgi:predicted small metal-binding protein
MTIKAVHCTCGIAIRNREEAQLIREVQKHASEAHDLTLNDEQVRAMMVIEQDETNKV